MSDRQRSKPSAGVELAGDDSQAPAVYALKRSGAGWFLTRRDFLAAAATAAAVGACEREAEGPPVHGAKPPSARADRRDTRRAEKEPDVPGRAHKDAISCLVITPDGKLLVSASKDKTLKLWSLPTGALVKTLGGQEATVEHLIVHPGGKLMASSSGGKTVRIWSLPDSALAQKLTPQDGHVGCIAMSPDGGLLASGSKNDAVTLWSMPDGVPLKTLKATGPAARKADIRCLAIAPDGKLLAAGSGDRAVRLWSLPYGYRKLLTGHTSPVGLLAMSADGKLLVSGGDNGMLNLWSLPGGVLLKKLATGTPAAGGQRDQYLAMSADGKLLAAATCDRPVAFQTDRRRRAPPSDGPVRPIRLWSLPGGTLVSALGGHSGGVTCLSIGPDGKLLVLGDYNTVKLWSLPGRALFKTLEGHVGNITCLTMTPDGKLLASASVDGAIKLWSLPEGELKGNLMDVAASPKAAKGRQFKARNEHGQWVTYTLPCGSPIPPGAVCVCNCVPGSYSIPSRSRSGRVCTCVPVHYWYPN